MRVLASFAVALCFIGFCGVNALSQKTKTIILVRHAEKNASDSADANDPALSPAGEARVAQLLKRLKKYRPGAVYSTDYIRTRSTVEPIAKYRKIQLQIYDPKVQAQLVDQIMKSRTKRFVVAGHSNTIPLLANLLIKKEIFKPLDDNEYGTIWVIKLKEGEPPKVVEVLSY